MDRHLGVGAAIARYLSSLHCIHGQQGGQMAETEAKLDMKKFYI